MQHTIPKTLGGKINAAVGFKTPQRIRNAWDRLTHFVGRRNVVANTHNLTKPQTWLIPAYRYKVDSYTPRTAASALRDLRIPDCAHIECKQAVYLFGRDDGMRGYIVYM